MYVGIAQCMNALADKVHNRHAHSVMQSITWPHYSTNNVAMLWSAYITVCLALLVMFMYFASQCIHALSHPYIHGV